MKCVLQLLKQSHGTISYGHRFKAAAHLWTQRLDVTGVEISTKTNTPVSKIPKPMLQQKAWENSQRDMSSILKQLAQSVEQSARLEAEAGDNMHIDVPRANSDYNRHMQQTLARLKEEQPHTPYQARFKLAASMWQDRKREKQERSGVENNAEKKNDPLPLYTNEAMEMSTDMKPYAYSPEDEDFVLQGPSSSAHQPRIPIRYYNSSDMSFNIPTLAPYSPLATTDSFIPTQISPPPIAPPAPPFEQFQLIDEHYHQNNIFNDYDYFYEM